MIDLTDGLLNAYLDDELDDQTRASVAKALQDTPGAQLRLDRMRANDERVRDAFALPGAQSDDSLAAQILAGDDLFAAQPRREAAWRKRGFAAMGALAAGLFGLFAGRIMLPPSGGNPSHEYIAALDTSAVRILNQSLSGATDAQTRITVSYTFEAKDGRYCRQFQSPAGEGVACREKGAWRLAAWDSSAPAVSDDQYEMAGASSLIDAAVDSLAAGDALSATEEKALIAKAWR